MKLENICIPSNFMRHGMTLRNFFEEVATHTLPGMPYVDDQDRIIGRISLRDVYKKIAIPEHLLPFAHMMGDDNDNFDLKEINVREIMQLPVEEFVLADMPTVSPKSSIVKALTLMESHNSSYIFLIDNGKYLGLVTRMIIAKRMTSCVMQHEQISHTLP